jgi:hypothetical protein
VVLATERLNWQPAHYGLLAVLNLVGSKVWFTINPDWTNTLMRTNIGPWISHGSYAVHGVLVLICVFVVRQLLIPASASSRPPLASGMSCSENATLPVSFT